MTSSLLTAGRDPMDLEAIGQQAERAQKILGKVRRAMLAPDAAKTAPTFSGAQLGSLLNLDTRQVNDRLRRGRLPAGRVSATGGRREFSLTEVQTWCRELRADRMRPGGGDAEAVTVAVANFKGGVAKTTTAVTLAQGLSLRGHKVLVVDCDPQGSLTTLFGILPDAEVESEQTILPLCLGEQELITYAIRPTYWAGIDLVPAQSVLFSAEFALPGRQKDEGPSFRFWDVLNMGLEQARQDYDVIIVDTPPALSYVTINAMMAADGLIMPLPPSALDFASSVQFWRLFHDLATQLGERGKKKSFAFVDVLLSKVDSADVATSVVREWISAAYGSTVLPIEIPKTATAGSASAEFGSVYDLKPSAASSRTLRRALDAYDQFVTTVETQLIAAWARQVEEIRR